MFLRTSIIIFLAIINLAIFGKVIWGQTGLMEYRSLKQQLADLRGRISSLDRENLALSNEIRLLQTDHLYMEKVIRQQLHYLRDNELVYIFASAPEKEPGVKSNDREN